MSSEALARSVPSGADSGIEARVGSRLLFLIPALVLAAALAALFLALVLGGGAAPQVLGDPGAAVRWGLPMLKLLLNLAASVTIGGLVLAAAVFSHRERAFHVTMDVAAAAAGVWAVAAAGSLVLSVVSLSPDAILDPTFGNLLISFATEYSVGQAWSATAALAAFVTVAAMMFRGPAAAMALAVASGIALLPLALIGHSDGSDNHNSAVITMALHMLAAAVWFGGLLVLAVVMSTLTTARSGVVVARYSTIALFAYVVVAASGTLSAVDRVGAVSGLATPYGVILLAKVVILLILGGLGAYYRSRVIKRMRVGAERVAKLFWRIAVVELVLIAAASGLAAGLARTIPPVSEFNPPAASPAEVLTGRLTPPAPTASTFLTQWELDLFWALLCAFAVIIYLGGVLRLSRRGTVWPVFRTCSWAIGWLIVFYLTNGRPAVYDEYLIGDNLVRYLGLALVAPLLLVAAKPSALVLTAVEERGDASIGLRELVAKTRGSSLGRLLAQPLFSIGLMLSSLTVYFISPALTWSMSSIYGRELLSIYFLAVGFAAAAAVTAPHAKLVRATRAHSVAVAVFSAGLVGFSLFFSLSGRVLAVEWFQALELPWGISLVAHQQASSIGPLVLAGALLVIGLIARLTSNLHIPKVDAVVGLPVSAKSKLDGDSRSSAGLKEK